MKHPALLFPGSRRGLCLLLALLLLVGVSGCTAQPIAPTTEPPAITGSLPELSSALPPQTTVEITSETAAESAAPDTEAPVTTEAEPEAPVPLSVEEAVRLYEAVPLDYTPVEREAETPNDPLPAPRYSLGEDGVWRRKADSASSAVLMLTGDLMCQTRQQEAGRTETGYDFRGSFHYVQPIFAEADLVIGNLEATLSESAPYMAEQPSVEDKPHLNAPAVFLEAVRAAGFDAVVMSNNHNCDAGVRGVYDTLDRAEEYGLIHTGTFRNEREPRYTLIEVNGIRFGLLSYATFFNKKEIHFTPEGIRTLLNRYDPETAAADAEAARQAGAEYLLVYIHWGTEYTNTPNEKQYRIAQELADAGFDFIVGSHPHALQPYGTVTSGDGRIVPVIYSMGNFVSHQTKTVTKDTIILRLVFERDAEGNVILAEQGYLPCRVFKRFGDYDYAILPLTSPYNQGLQSSYFAPALERITAVIGPELPLLGEE